MSDINDTGKIPMDEIRELDNAATLPGAEVPEILIITGMSGAGRSRASAALEDLGWYVVDNLPPRLLSAMAGLLTQGTKLAAVVDVRSRDYFQELVGILDSFTESNITYRIMFLDASDEVLVRRYEQVRRPHPLQGDGRLMTGIIKERELLAALRKRADVLIDTSTLSVHDLARKIRNNVASESEAAIHLTVMSFGFKYGIPLDADHVVDVRFIPNPYWITELRHLTGKDEPVADFVLGIDGVEDFVENYAALMAPIFDGYIRELKPYVSIAIGCTGGKHRSVAIAEKLSELLRTQGLAVKTFHRDLGRE